jgi:hypothetical protein
MTKYSDSPKQGVLSETVPAGLEPGRETKFPRRIVPSHETVKAHLARDYYGLQAAPPKKSRWSRIGWKLGLMIDLALLSLPVPAVIVLPPLLECRQTEVNVGFFAGDSFEACAQRRIVARWNHLDSQLKMIIRGSGR